MAKIARFGDLAIHGEFCIASALFIKVDDFRAMDAHGKVRFFMATTVVDAI